MAYHQAGAPPPQHHDGGDRAGAGKHENTQWDNADIFFSMLSWVSLAVSFICERRAQSMPIPINNRMITPAILNAGRVIPKSLKMSFPRAAKLHKTMRQVQVAGRAMRSRCFCSASAVMIKKWVQRRSDQPRLK